MPVTFNQISVGDTYSRHDLTLLRGYAGVEAISRGVVTPRGDSKIVLFVTQDKHPMATPYDDQLADSVYFGKDRMIILQRRGSLHIIVHWKKYISSTATLPMTTLHTWVS